MSTFADSSALVKLYAVEDHHDEVRSIEVLVVSCLARVEVPAALWRKHRLGELTMTDAAMLTADFEEDFLGDEHLGPRFLAMALIAPVLDRAARVAATHRLRAYDAVQLASAIEARSADPGCVAFACFDGELRAAAAAEAFELIPT